MNEGIRKRRIINDEWEVDEGIRKRGIINDKWEVDEGIKNQELRMRN